MKVDAYNYEQMMSIISFDPDCLQLRKKGILVVADDVSDELARCFLRDVSIIIAENQVKEITIKICTSGGNAEAGLGMIDMINVAKKAGINVIGEVYGKAMSMGFLILQACSTRIVHKSSILMAHGISVHVPEGDSKNLESESKIMGEMKEYCARLVADRNTSQEDTYHEVGFWIEVFGDNTPQYFTAKDSLEMGLVDRIEE